MTKLKTKLLVPLMAMAMAACGVVEDGYDGLDGQDGVDGVDGVDGQDGEDGADGEDGHDGKDCTLNASLAACAPEDIFDFYMSEEEVEVSFDDCTRMDLNILEPTTCLAGGTYKVLLNLDGSESAISWSVVCFTDNDDDGRRNTTDNCQSTFNPFQEDMDGDGKGDVCDGDMDGDGVMNTHDQCGATPGVSVAAVCNVENAFTGFYCPPSMVTSLDEDPENNDCVDANGLLHQWVYVDCTSHGCPLDN